MSPEHNPTGAMRAQLAWYVATRAAFAGAVVLAVNGFSPYLHGGRGNEQHYPIAVLDCHGVVLSRPDAPLPALAMVVTRRPPGTAPERIAAYPLMLAPADEAGTESEGSGHRAEFRERVELSLARSSWSGIADSWAERLENALGVSARESQGLWHPEWFAVSVEARDGPLPTPAEAFFPPGAGKTSTSVELAVDMR